MNEPLDLEDEDEDEDEDKDKDKERILWNKFQEKYGQEVYFLVKKAQILRRIALIIMIILVLAVVLGLPLLSFKQVENSNIVLASMFFIYAQTIPIGILIWSGRIVLRYNNLWRKFKEENQAIN